MKTLNIHLNHPAERALTTFGSTLQQLEAGQPVTPHVSIGKDEHGKVFVPWDEVDVRLPLPAAA